MKPTKGIAVDGYCHGNPGQGGYRGVCLETGKELFRSDYPYITNNLAEFLGICHAVGLIKTKKLDYPAVYSDSQIAISWFNSQRISTGISPQKGETALRGMHKCLKWLSEQKSLVSVCKWNTKEWGEVPADFGNKR